MTIQVNPNTGLEMLGTLVAAGTATTNPDPNTLATKNPYPTPFVDRYTAAAAWTAQALTKCPMFVPLGMVDGRGQVPIDIWYRPSVAGATFTVTYWKWNSITLTWAKPFTNPSQNYTGEVWDYIFTPGVNPWFPQLSSISSGNIAIYYNNQVVRAV